MNHILNIAYNKAIKTSLSRKHALEYCQLFTKEVIMYYNPMVVMERKNMKTLIWKNKIGGYTIKWFYIFILQ